MDTELGIYLGKVGTLLYNLCIIIHHQSGPNMSLSRHGRDECLIMITIVPTLADHDSHNT